MKTESVIKNTAVKVRFTSALKPFFPELREIDLPAGTVRELMDEVEVIFPGISGYLLEEDGGLRKHVNIFIGNDLIRDRAGLSDHVEPGMELLFYQALSGG